MKRIILSLSLASTLLSAHNNEDLLSLSLEELLNIEVTTTSKYSEKLLDSPANIFLFTKETIRERGYFNVEDILESLPSVDVNKFSRSLSRDDISIRGINGNNKFLILLNGVRISAPAGGTIHTGYNFPVSHAKQVEVLLGPAGVVYGADAYAGVINILTETDADVVELYASVGQDKYLNSFANVSHNFDKFHINAFISGYRSQEYNTASEYATLYPSPTPSNVQGDYSFSPTQDVVFFTNIASDNFEVGVNHFEHEASMNFVFKPDKASFDAESQDQNRMTNIYAKAKFDINSKLHSDTTLSYARSEQNHKTYFNNLFSGFKHAYKYAKVDKYSLNQDFTLKLESHQLSLGISLDYIDVIPRGPDLPEPYDIGKSSKNQNLTYITDPSVPINFNEYSYENYGFYIQDNYKINEQLRVVVGARYDYNTLYDDTFNPRASLIYKPSNHDVFKVLYSNAFLAPASDQVYNEYGDVTGKNGRFRQVSNSNLKPEELQTIELNYEHFFSANTHVKIAPYYSEIENLILENFTYSTKTQIFDNIGHSEIYGVDMTLDDTSKFGEFVLKSWLNVSYTHANVHTKLNETYATPQVAEYKAKAGSTMIYADNFYITPKLYYIGETPTNKNLSSKDTRKQIVDAYFYMDLNVRYQMLKGLYITADVYNLFDKRYYSATSGKNEKITFVGAPQPGRLITAGLYYKF